LPKLIDLLRKHGQNNVLEKFLLQGKQVYLRNVLSRQADHLQEIANLVINIVLSVWMFKIQGSEKTCSIQPLWIQDSKFGLRKKLFQSNLFGFNIQDSRFKAQKKLVQSNLFGFKIQDSRLNFFFFNPTCLDSRCKMQDSRFKAQNFFFNPTSLDSRFKIQGSRLRKKNRQPNLFGFKTKDSRLRKNFFNPTSLDSRFKIRAQKKNSSIQSLWIQDSTFKAKKKLFQSHLFGFKIQDSRLRKKFFNPTCLDSRCKIQDSRLRKNLFNPISLDLRFKIEG